MLEGDGELANKSTCHCFLVISGTCADMLGRLSVSGMTIPNQSEPDKRNTEMERNVQHFVFHMNLESGLQLMPSCLVGLRSVGPPRADAITGWHPSHELLVGMNAVCACVNESPSKVVVILNVRGTEGDDARTGRKDVDPSKSPADIANFVGDGVGERRLILIPALLVDNNNEPFAAKHDPRQHQG